MSQAAVVKAVSCDEADPRRREAQKKRQDLKARGQKELDHSGLPWLMDADKRTGLWRIIAPA
jgi:hypothetical protein